MSRTDSSEALGSPSAPALEELQVSPGLRVQHHVRLGGVGMQRGELRKSGLLIPAQVVDYGAAALAARGRPWQPNASSEATPKCFRSASVAHSK